MRAARAVTGRKSARTHIIRIKIISLGDTSVGKSCLIKRYCEGKFVAKYIPTIGVDYGVKPVSLGDFEVRVNIWDLAGPREYVEVRNEFYKDAQGGVLVYDVTNRSSFESLSAWVEETKRNGASDMVLVVAATKADQPSRKVTEKEGRDWAMSQGMQFFEVSAASGEGVAFLFSSLFACVLSIVPGVPQEVAMYAVQDLTKLRESLA